jgi:hypothetical protein
VARGVLGGAVVCGGAAVKDIGNLDTSGCLYHAIDCGSALLGEAASSACSLGVSGLAERGFTGQSEGQRMAL